MTAGHGAVDNRDVDVAGWHGIEMRHLAALIAVRAADSFRGAADQLGYVQSAVSQQIAHLERIAGTRLIERTRGHQQIAFTEAGELMLEHAERIIGQLRAAEADLTSTTQGSGALTIGACGVVASTLLPQILSLRQHGVRTVETLADADLFPLVERGEVDAAFAELPLLPGPFTGITVLTEPVVLLVHADSSAARAGRPPTLAELASLPLIADSTWRMLPRIEEWIAAAGHELEFAMAASSIEAIHALVAAGLGAALAPRMAADPTFPGVAVIEVGDLLGARRIALYWHAQRRSNDTLDRFRAATLAICAGIDPAAVRAGTAA